MTAATAIFLNGIFERSGTNYLWYLLRVHPDVSPRPPIFEDNLLREAGLLQRYVDLTFASWSDPRWKVPPEERTALFAALGAGLEQFLTAGAPTPRVVVKTPSVRNLSLFFELFPDRPLIVLVRDGRSVVESAVRSFGRDYGLTMKQWARAARRVADATRRFDAAGHRYLLVRYEQLVDDLPGVMRRILDHADLDPARYDFDAAARVPVVGSSTDRPDPDAEVVWTRYVQRPAGFAGARRYADWDPALHALFHDLAGEASAAIGYPLPPRPRLDAAARRRYAGLRAALLREEAALARRLVSGEASRLAGRLTELRGR